MTRRRFIHGAAGALALTTRLPAWAAEPVGGGTGRWSNAPAWDGPLCVYNNWSTYDELSDNVPLNEPLALRQVDA